MRHIIQESPVVQEDPPNALPLQSVFKENDSFSLRWEDLEKIFGVPNSTLFFLAVEYIQDVGNIEAEFSNYLLSITENERLSPCDSSLNSENCSASYNALVIPSDRQSEFPDSVLVLPASGNNSEQIGIVVEQSQVRRELIVEEDKSGNLKFNGETSDSENSQQTSIVAEINCDDNSALVGPKLIITASPKILLSQNIDASEKTDLLASGNVFFQSETQKLLSSSDLITAHCSVVQNEFSLPASHETILLNETVEESNKSFTDPSKYVIDGDGVKSDELLLPDSSQNHNLVMKSDALMEVDLYSVTPATYITPEDGNLYPIIEEQLNLNNIEKVDNEYLLLDGVTFEGSDLGVLQSNLEVFTSEDLDSNELPSYDKTRLRQNKKSLSEHLNFDYCCEDCEFGVKCLRHEVKIISDKPVLPRARATLPQELLAISKLHESTNEEGVFARKTIMRRVQFGPVEGKLLRDWEKSKKIDSDVVEFLLETENGQLVKLDVSDEGESNWMRFVRKAKTLKEQNLILTQQGKSLYFTTTQVIPPRHELKVGYSPQYAEKRKLLVLEDICWNCFECSVMLSTSDELQNHLIVHGNEKELSEKPKRKLKNLAFRRTSNLSIRRKKRRMPSNEKKTLGAKENECWSCHKIFRKGVSFKRHLTLIHPEKDKENSGFVKNVKEKTDKLSVKSTLFKQKHSNGSGSEWLCTHCNLTFDNPSVLNLHTLTHAAEDLESEAVLGLPSELSSVYHEGEFLIEKGDVQCPQCTQEFPSKRELIDHVSTHGKMTLKKCCSKPPKPFKCDQCYKAFSTDISLKKHMLVHGSEESKPYECDICLKRFLNTSAVACHRKTHNDKKVFNCPVCNKEFEKLLGLREHVKIHSNDGFFTCPHCSKVFEGYKLIRKHVRTFHSGLHHICNECGKLCVTLDKLKMHSLKHSDHREFLCANCGKQFKRKDKLKDHMKRVHSGEREMNLSSSDLPTPNSKGRKFPPKMSPTAFDRFIYKCRDCMIGFKRRGMLVNHLAKRHPDVVPDTVPELNLPIMKTTKDYFCQYCDKIYKSSSKRKAHILKNHPGAELPMSTRQKGGIPNLPGVPNPTFSKTVGSVRTTPHGCKWCHKQYASKAKLLQHQRKKHTSLLPKAEQAPRAKRSLRFAGCKETDNSENSMELVKCEGNKEEDCERDRGKINEISVTQNAKGSFEVGGEITQETDEVHKKNVRIVPENISCDLFQAAMTDLNQSLSDYKLPFTGTQETLLKMIELKDGSVEGIVREETIPAVQMTRNWQHLPPYPPR